MTDMRDRDRIGMKGLVFDPCGHVPDNGDFLPVMKENARSLRAACEE
jgi:hypothetical protein